MGCFSYLPTWQIPTNPQIFVSKKKNRTRLVGKAPWQPVVFLRVFFPVEKNVFVASKIGSPEVGLFTGYAPAMSILGRKKKHGVGVEMCGRKISFVEGKKVDVKAI